jgi:hypothetical protein
MVVVEGEEGYLGVAHRKRRLRSSSQGGSTVAEEKYSDVIRLASTTSKVLDGFENSPLQVFQRHILLAGKNFPEAGDTKQLLFWVHCLGDAIAE